MKKRLTNQRGITLVEILASIVIIGFLAIFIINIQVKSTEQYNKQFTTNQQLKEISYVLKTITKDIRKTNNVTLTNQTNIKNEQNEILYTGISVNNKQYIFDKQSKSIKLNGSIYANNINDFSISNTGDRYIIIIKNLKGSQVTTTVYIRSANQ
ncbi:type II secretion system GspH family protein [Rummeliibacillus sp. G93]|uniref:type II secretion system protein n=1 Tax=Rummeliibacillus sp. G93 TaxID=2939494 RepID=UPI00201C1752|nr:type II secretion system protein [Rummeliibacillus sp. G93]UQW96383.1 type II secretion system GspH family protein [Rummeliibacillus sp. G93]